MGQLSLSFKWTVRNGRSRPEMASARAHRRQQGAEHDVDADPCEWGGDTSREYASKLDWVPQLDPRGQSLCSGRSREKRGASALIAPPAKFWFIDFIGENWVRFGGIEFPHRTNIEYEILFYDVLENKYTTITIYQVRDLQHILGYLC